MYNLLYSGVSAIIDVVALVILFWFAYRGFSRGFVKSFISVFGSFFALLIAVLLASKVTVFIEFKFGWVSSLSNSLASKLSSVFGSVLMDTTLEQVSENALSEYGIASWLINIVLASIDHSSIPMDTTLNQIICPTLSYYLVLALSVIVLFILFKAIFFIVGDLMQKMHKIKIVKKVDKTLGIIFGALSGFVVLELAIMIIGIIPLNIFIDLHLAITSSPITGFFHKINVFNLILHSVAQADVIDIIINLIG